LEGKKEEEVVEILFLELLSNYFLFISFSNLIWDGCFLLIQIKEP